MKARCWQFLLYPESCNPEFIKYMYDSGLKGAISPLHDSDLRDDGTLKKSHYHVILLFNGGRTEQAVKEIVQEINVANNIIQKVNDKQARFEYLTHKNNPEKYQYNPEDIIFINAHSYDFIDEDYRCILDYIDDNKIKSIVGLLKALRKENNNRLIKYVSNNTYYVQTYLRALQIDYDSRIETLLHSLYNNYGDVRINKDVLNKLCEVFDEVKINNET